MYNCVTTALRSNEDQPTDIWKLSEASRYQSLFNPYQKQYEQRLHHQLSSPRVTAVSVHETADKCFVLQKLEDASIFLESDIARYKALNLGYSNNNSPSSTEDLLKFQELILLDIRFLAGCDIDWGHQNQMPTSTDTAAADKSIANKAPIGKTGSVKEAKSPA
jgi:hypothetical protein